jgi:branched-chain amino acid transport system permease protein
LIGPALLVVGVALVGSLTSGSLEFQFRVVLVTASLVVALHVFVGNSGVISFGHVSFVALGAMSAGLATTPVDIKSRSMSDLFPILADLQLSNVESLALAAVLGGVFAFVVGVPIMRLSGLQAGIATFAVIIITNNVFRNWDRIGSAARALGPIPETTGFVQATVGLLLAIVVAYIYQATRQARMLRAAREDPAAAQSSGVNIYRQRLLAFTISGAMAGLSGGLLAHLFGSITTEVVFLDLTFITLAMLVVGGIGSLWGAVIGALSIAGLNSFLAEAEREVTVIGLDIDLPSGTRLVVLGIIMAAVLLFRPSGLTGGRELTWPFARRGRFAPGG